MCRRLQVRLPARPRCRLPDGYWCRVPDGHGGRFAGGGAGGAWLVLHAEGAVPPGGRGRGAAWQAASWWARGGGERMRARFWDGREQQAASRVGILTLVAAGQGELRNVRLHNRAEILDPLPIRR